MADLPVLRRMEVERKGDAAQEKTFNTCTITIQDPTAANALALKTENPNSGAVRVNWRSQQ